MSLRHDLFELVRDLSAEDSASFDLWTWLPSYQDAKVKHGHYADQFRPSNADIMREATLFISHKLNPTDEERREAGDLYQCPNDPS